MINMLNTIKGSMIEGFFPAGWDLERIAYCCSQSPNSINERQPFWHPEFEPISCESLEDFNVKIGHEVALEIKHARDEGRKLILILPVGPMGMYKWIVFFLHEWGVSASHVHGFNMDEWSDCDGNTLPSSNSGSFQNAMENSFYGPLKNLTIPDNQRNFATKKILPNYEDKIDKLRSQGAKLIVVFGIGRVFHIAFWEPHFACDFSSLSEWKAQTHRLGAKLHPLTIEQNAVTSFKSNTSLVPCFANTIGPGIFLKADKVIGGCDGIFGRGMQWQGMSLWVTLRYGPDMWMPSTFMPTMPGKILFVNDLSGPLIAECN